MRAFPERTRPTGRPAPGLLVRLLALAAVLAAAWPASADRLVLTNGQAFTGRLVWRDEHRVVFEIHADGMILKRTFRSEEVAEVHRGPLYAGKHYYVVPVRGHIGTDVTAGVLARCLDLAGENLTGVVPDMVVLDIDSPGGDANELLRILDTLERYRRLRIVAYVRSASSAAAVIALSRREIVMAPDGSLGGIVVYRCTPEGTPANIEEKMQSIWRAKFRAVAAQAGHEPLLVEGMMRTDIALSLVRRGGRTRVVLGEAGELLKPKGRILTLSSAEAVRTGLAAGTAESIGECGRLVGVKEWRELLPETAGRIFEAWRHELDGARKRYHAATKRALELYDRAMAAHPGRFRYKVDTSGSFLPEHRKQWKQRSVACGQLLQKAEETLARAQKILKDYPQLGLKADEVVKFRSQCERIRKAVEADAGRTGLPAPPPPPK